MDQNSADLNVSTIKKNKLTGIDWSTYGDPVKLLTKKPAKPSPIPAIEPLTPDEWEAFDGKQRWDCQVALRGPDLRGSQAVKWFTSSIIRYKLSGVMRVGGLVNRHLPFIVMPNLGGINPASKGSFDWSHFLGHIYDAACILNIPMVHVDWTVWQATVLAREHATHCELELLKHLPYPFKAALQVHLERQGYTFPEMTEEAAPCE